jgi:hypothetical protein
MDIDIIGQCWHCGRDHTKCDYGRETLCLGCGKATRVCRNCRHFAPGRPNACLEPLTELVLNKERANFCELFDAAQRPGTGLSQNRPTELLQRAQDLFK